MNLLFFLDWRIKCGSDGMIIYMRGSFPHPNILVRKARSALADFEEASSSIKGPVQMQSREKDFWKAPSLGMYKANWDAFVNSQSDQVGISMVIRDQYWSVKAAQCCFCMGIFDPTTAKAMVAV